MARPDAFVFLQKGSCPMPLYPQEINPEWVSFESATPVGEIHFKISPDERRKVWIVVPRGGERFAVFKYADMVQAVKDFTHAVEPRAEMLNLTLDELNFLERFTRAAAHQETDDLYALREQWHPPADPPLVVLQNGAPIGVLKSSTRGGGDEVDWFGDIGMAQANGGDHPKNGGDEPKSPGTLGPAAPPPAAPPARKINARFDPPEQKDAPLQVGETYTLVFSVDMEQLAQTIAAADLDETRFFPPNVEQVDIYVQLVSDDFEILTDPQKLIVPRQGKSKNKARFDISPKQNGVGEITAVFLKDGNAVQAIALKLNVGVGNAAIAESKTLGRTVEAAGAVGARSLTLWIDYKGEGFKVSVLGPNENVSFMIPLQLHELELAIGKAREALKTIVETQDAGMLAYQQRIDISAAVKNKTLPMLARAGALLFQTIFMHPGSNQAAKDFAKRFRALAQGEPMHIQIVSKQLMLPWGILYMADKFDANSIQPELFLGLKHIIEHAPMEPNMDFPPDIASQPQLLVSLNLNQEIDQQMGFPLIKNQIQYWNAKQNKGGVKIITRTRGSDVVNALADENTPDQIAYFYCHAVSKNLNEGGANASTLQFGAQQSVTLEDLLLSAPLDTRLKGSPLVFINACESAELSPLFYNGFMPYFVDKGARGMIGTECPVPALFALDWAGKFFDAFLAGKPLGQVFLDLRRDYFYNHNNILGLLYAVYCDADTRVEPAVG
jgi:hypothetical protein